MKWDKSINLVNAVLIGLILFNIYSFITGRLPKLNLMILGSVQIFLIGFINSVHHSWVNHIKDEDIME